MCILIMMSIKNILEYIFHSFGIQLIPYLNIQSGICIDMEMEYHHLFYVLLNHMMCIDYYFN